VTSRPAQQLRDLALLRRVRDRIDREYAQPLDVEALARGANMSAGHLSRAFKLAYGEAPYGYLMTRRIERAMALLRLAELVGMPPSEYRRLAHTDAGIPSCVAKQVTRPIRNREVPAAGRR
jgi:YesN/AraC family two-component response regulator